MIHPPLRLLSYTGIPIEKDWRPPAIFLGLAFHRKAKKDFLLV